MQKVSFFFAVLLVFAGSNLCAQTTPSVSIQNIDLGVNPEFNNWRHNSDYDTLLVYTDTFLVVPITMDDFVDSVDSFSFNLVYDPLKLEPLPNGYEINDPAYIITQNYLTGVPFPMVDGRIFSMTTHSVPGGNEMLSITYSDTVPFSLGIFGDCGGLLLYVPFKNLDPCAGRTDSIIAWNGYVDSTSTYLNPLQPNTFILSGSQGVLSVDSGTLSLNNGSMKFVHLEATVSEFQGNLEGSVNHGVAPYQFMWSNGETTQNITPNISGDYFVVATDAMGCTDTSATYSFTFVTGIEHAMGSTIFLYPNPFSENFVVQVFGEITATVYSMHGKKLKNVSGTNKITINRDDLAKGSYILKTRVNSDWFYHNIIVY